MDNKSTVATLDSVTFGKETFRLPLVKTLLNAAKLAITEDKPVLFDYWAPSISQTVQIGVNKLDNKERMLVKNEEEYTSLIQKAIRVVDPNNTQYTDFIIITENSIYLVDSQIKIVTLDF